MKRLAAIIAACMVTGCETAPGPTLTEPEVRAMSTPELEAMLMTYAESRPSGWQPADEVAATRESINLARLHYVARRVESGDLTDDEAVAIAQSELVLGTPAWAVPLAWGAPSARVSETSAHGTVERWPHDTSWMRDFGPRGRVTIDNGYVAWWKIGD